MPYRRCTWPKKGASAARVSRTMFVDGVERAFGLNDRRTARRLDRHDVGGAAPCDGGAIARVPADATAFAHRDRRIMANVATLFEDPDQEATHQAWVTGLHDDCGVTPRVRTSTSWGTRARNASTRPTRARRGPPRADQGRGRPGQRLPPQPEHRAWPTMKRPTPARSGRTPSAQGRGPSCPRCGPALRADGPARSGSRPRARAPFPA